MESAVRPKRRSLLRSTSNFASMTLISRILGFIRDLVIARTFGTSPVTDAFVMAYKIPNMMRALFAEGAFSQAFIPTLSQVQSNNQIEDVKRFISHTTGVMLLVLTLFTTFCVIISPAIVSVTAPGFLDEPFRFNLTSDLLRITLPYILLISITALLSSVLNTYGYFGVTGFTPVLLNLSMIGAALFISPYFEIPIKALAWGVLVAGFLQLAFQVPFLYQAKVNFIPSVNWSDLDVKNVFKLMLPAMFGVAVTQINVFIDSLFATFLIAGSVSWLYFAVQLSNLPIGLFGVSITTVLMPKLSRSHYNNQKIDFYSSFEWGLRMVLLISVPSALGLSILAKPILVNLFLGGEIKPSDIEMIAGALVPLALGLPAFMLIKIFTSGFYATKSIITPVKVAAVASLINIILNVILIKPLAHVGLAIATSVAAYANMIGLAILTKTQHRYVAQSSWLKFYSQLIIANLGMVIWISTRILDINTWLSFSFSERISHLFIDIIVSAVVYISLLLICGIRVKDINPNQEA